MEHIVTQPSETVIDITCDACCQSTRVEGYGQQFVTLQAHWGYGSKHEGERYEVRLCELCFFRTLSHLRRERMVNTMFDEEPIRVRDLALDVTPSVRLHGKWRKQRTVPL